MQSIWYGYYLSAVEAAWLMARQRHFTARNTGNFSSHKVSFRVSPCRLYFLLRSLGIVYRHRLNSTDRTYCVLLTALIIGSSNIAVPRLELSHPDHLLVVLSGPSPFATSSLKLA
jgi:hypothetical protein